MHHSNIVIIIVAICNDISPKLKKSQAIGWLEAKKMR